ncbi:hypothetical protein Mycsm_04293 [Mycobacterium sp. JS623]|uniref:hypothetical protein n=1 Tax=Mycobacterium sp. JS623 TaxID=212767 RepID=UPI0002A597FC|nr:hypothetical protein [Mycobacterium sp. JS623]AGB24541.1 hypothetical protein Mycsm_04293 [Mycobacterium sp. JS623]
MSPAEHDREHALVFAEYRQTVEQLRHRPTEELRERLVAQCDMLNYSDQVRASLGGWPRFYRVTGGKVHTDLRCRGLSGRNDRAVVEMLPSLSGLAMVDVTICGHCKARRGVSS